MFLMHLTVLDVESTLCILSVDRKREVSKFNVGVVLIIAIHEISNRENEFDVNSRNIHSSKITRYTVLFSKLCHKSSHVCDITIPFTRCFWSKRSRKPSLNL